MNKLKFLRQRKGITQEKLAVVSGLSIQQIKKMETNDFNFHSCKIETLEKVATAFKVSINYFLY